MKKIAYSITKHQCTTQIGDRVCPSCGKPVKPIRTVDNARNPTFWAGCRKCGRFNWGVSKEVFRVAKDMVDNQHYIAYGHLGVKDNHPESDHAEWYRSQYSGTCDTVMQVLRTHKNING